MKAYSSPNEPTRDGEIEILSALSQNETLGAQGAKARPTRREREKLERREQVLESALSLFSERGYHDVSMQEIAQAAEFAIGTLYTFFESKDALYSALLKTYSDKFHLGLTEALEGRGKAIERIEAVARAQCRLFTESAPVVRLYLAETRGANSSVTARLEGELRELHEGYLEKLADAFAEATAEGDVVEADSSALAFAFDSMINAFMFEHVRSSPGTPCEPKIQTLMDIFFGPVLTNGRKCELFDGAGEAPITND